MAVHLMLCLGLEIAAFCYSCNYF